MHVTRWFFINKELENPNTQYTYIFYKIHIKIELSPFDNVIQKVLFTYKQTDIIIWSQNL